jgi:hypothetical protein
MNNEREEYLSPLPNFLLAGAVKCGTTSLYQGLSQHPDIFTSEPKEPDFFFAQFAEIPTKGPGDDCCPVVQGRTDYVRLFEKAAGRKVIGEGSHTSLFYHEKTIPLIKKYLGDPKIILILRNPVDRALAAYTALLREGREFLPFEEALREEVSRIRDHWRSVWFYREAGLFYAQVKAFRESFSAVKICFYEDLRTEPGTLFRELFRFLEVDESFTPLIRSSAGDAASSPRTDLWKGLHKRQPGPVQRFARVIGRRLLGDSRWVGLRDRVRARTLIPAEMKPETRRALVHGFRDDILKLQDLLGKDLSPWLTETASGSA